MRCLLTPVFVLATVASAIGAESVEFIGVISGSREVQVALRDKETGTSRWLARGDSFQGYTFKTFDPKENIAVLGKDNGDISLHLIPSAKAKDGAAGANLTPATAMAIYLNLRMIIAASDQYYLVHGVKSVTLGQLVGPDNYIKELVAVAGEDYSTVTLRQGIVPVITTPSGETIAAHTSDFSGVSYGFYGVEPGDTGAKIASMAKITLGELQALNDGVDWPRLKVGQVVRVK